jgi:hypothetical protein
MSVVGALKESEQNNHLPIYGRNQQYSLLCQQTLGRALPGVYGHALVTPFEVIFGVYLVYFSLLRTFLNGTIEILILRVDLSLQRFS